MKKALLVLTFILVLGLLVAGCAKQAETPDQKDGAGDNLSSSADGSAYVDDQIVDENSTIEIGEMI